MQKMSVTSISSRNAKEHILTGGVWCSCQKPSTEAFLKPVMETIKDLETQGSWQHVRVS